MEPHNVLFEPEDFSAAAKWAKSEGIPTAGLIRRAVKLEIKRLEKQERKQK